MKMNIYIYRYNLEPLKFNVDSIDILEKIIFFEKREESKEWCLINDLNSFSCGCFFSLRELNKNELKKVCRRRWKFSGILFL